MKRRFFRRILAIICLITMLALTACNGGEADDIKSEPGSDSGSKLESSEAETDFVIPEMSVEESNGFATVSTTKGLIYTVSGYTQENNGRFTFTSGLEFGFAPETFSNEFNRFTMYYNATSPTHIYVTYKNYVGEDTVADFFVEAGNGDFSGLILDYLDKKTAAGISKIFVNTCDGGKGEFSLYHLAVEKIKCYVGKYGSTKYYVENERFKLGVDMSWGGAICYIEDLSCNIPNLTNLVNKADEGRLIQQSYYGTSAIPGVYEPGEFNNAKWNYNPVQGGDKYGNDSRIIDVIATKNSIYIKAQPQDWSLDGAITPSYMENTFILHDDYIEVKNRFVDFSGWKHPLTTQEIPAFYTVSYLDSFAWYDGSEPWTGDALSYRGDLNFWGDPLYANDCTFTLRQSNSESWCAWVNASNNFGMGVYVPNADVLLAGRLSYDGTKDADQGPCGYVAPLKKIRLVSYEPLEYSYLLTTGSVEEIRATFAEHKDFTKNECLDKNSVSMRLPDADVNYADIDFTNEKYSSVLIGHHNSITSTDEAEGALKAVITGIDPYATLSFKKLSIPYNADDYDTIEIEYMVPQTNSYNSYSIELFLSTGDVITAEAGKSIVKALVCDGEYHTLSVDLSSLSFWHGNINEIRLDFFTNSSADDLLFIKSIKMK
mgnify:CR=1 FL=1